MNMRIRYFSLGDCSGYGLAALAYMRGLHHSGAEVHWQPMVWRDGIARTAPRRVGHVAWETDRMPAHWFELLHGVDHLMVPCEWNRETFLAAGVATPISVVPHVRRHAVNEYTPAELDALRARLGVPAQHRVFYTIGEWRPRKALENLLRIYAQAFTGTDPVSLIIKTSRMAHTLQIGAEYVPTQQLFESTLAQLDRGCATLPP
jgi:hypothetical protein